MRCLLASIIVVCAAASAEANALLDQTGEFGPDPQSNKQQIEFQVPENTPRLVLDAKVTLTQGHASVRVVTPKGEKVFDAGTGGWMTLSGSSVRTAGESGVFRLELVPNQAVGTWAVTVRAGGPYDLQRIYLVLVSGAGMIAVAGLAVAAWRLQSRAAWRWFWVGAAVWTVGVGLKVVWALLLNDPILVAINGGVSHDLYLALGSIYIGLLTGVFEIGVTLIAGLIWRGMARDAMRGVAIGVGAGAFEAMLIGLAVLASAMAALLTTGPVQDQIVAAIAGPADVTPLFWLVGPVERLIAIACHVASRALVLVGIARRRWVLPFVVAFLLMSAIDAVAGYAHLAGVLGSVSPWWIELAIAPAAVASVPLLIWSIRNWPSAEPLGDPGAKEPAGFL